MECGWEEACHMAVRFKAMLNSPIKVFTFSLCVVYHIWNLEMDKFPLFICSCMTLYKDINYLNMNAQIYCVQYSDILTDTIVNA